MRKRGEQCVVILPLLIVFCCLLLSGGSRLIGHEGEEMALPQPTSMFRSALLCSAPARHTETGCVPVRECKDKAQTAVASIIRNEPDTSVCSDANGNVLRKETYLHAVYQAFSLGDGFA